MKEQFEQLLQEDEKIITVTKMNKMGAYFKYCLLPAILGVLLTIILLVISACTYTPEHMVETPNYWGNLSAYTQEMASGLPYYVSGIVFAIFAVITLITFLLVKLYSDHYAICLTNERIIICTGMVTNDYRYHALTNVSGNITAKCNQSLFDKGTNNACSVIFSIELLPVGHDKVNFLTPSILNGFEFAKQVEKVVKANAKKTNTTKTTEE